MSTVWQDKNGVIGADERPVLKGAQSRPEERVGAGGPANGSAGLEDAAAVRPAMTREGMPSVPNGRPGGRFNFENMFVERPAGGTIEVLAGGFEGADSVRRGDSGDELFTPLPCPENLGFGCHRQSGDAGFAILSHPPGMHGTGINAEDKDPFWRTIRLRDLPNGLA